MFYIKLLSNRGKQYLKPSRYNGEMKRVVPLNIQKELGELIITKSIETKKNYIWHFWQFLAFNRITTDDFRYGTAEQIKRWVGAYQNNIQGKSVSYHKSFLASVQNVLTTLDKSDISLKRFRRGIPEEQTPQGRGTWKPFEIRELVEMTTDKRSKAIILLMANSGVRLGSLYEMRVDDLTDYKDGCKKLVVYANSAKSRYVTFVGFDGSKAVDEYLKERESLEGRLDEGKPLFASYTRLKNGRIVVKPATKLAIKQSVRNLVEAYRRKKNIVIVEGQKRYSVSMAHSFRRFYKTGLSLAKVDSTNKKRLLGHALDVNKKYDSFETERLDEIVFEDFKMALPHLAIYREKYEIVEKERKIAELETEKDNKIRELESKVEMLMDGLEGMKDLLVSKKD